MSCQVCRTDFDTRNTALRFCQHCGWPLGTLKTELQPPAAALVGERDVEIAILCSNAGHGRLRCGVQSLPPGITRPAEAPETYDVGAEPQKITLLIAPGMIDRRAVELSVTLWAEDKRGRHSRDYRPADKQVCRQAHSPLRIPIERKRFGPVHVYEEMLLFRGSRRQQFLNLRNYGDVEATLTLSVPEGYGVSLPGKTTQETLQLTLLPRQIRERICVNVPMLKGVQKPTSAALHVEVMDLPDCSKSVELCWVPEPRLRLPEQRWIIGIDFGTSKSTVFVTDCHDPRREPLPITWRKPGSSDSFVKIPSVIMYQPGRSLPIFGWEVPETARMDTANVVIDSIKKRLAEDTTYTLPDGTTVSAESIVSRFLRGIISHVCEQDRFAASDDPFDSALVVMSLPVHDSEAVRNSTAVFDKQRELTVKAAVMAGLKESQIVCYPEPECAAADFLRRRNEVELAVQDGDHMCVFDCGAGTTDICILTLTFTNGEPTFTCAALAGFPIGGDAVDELLTSHVIQQWWNMGLLDGPVGSDGSLRLKKNNIVTPYNRSDLRNSLRSLKERLPLPDLEQQSANDTEEVAWLSNPFASECPVVITWKLIEELFSPYVTKMLHTGFAAADKIPDFSPQHPQGREVGVPLRSIKAKLADTPIDLPKVRWLCLTGGSSLIPFQVKMLRDLFGSRIRFVPPLAKLREANNAGNSSADFTLNVGRGAAIRPLSSIEGRLMTPVHFQLHVEGRGLEKKPGLTEGVGPGARSAQCSFLLDPGEAGTLRLMAVGCNDEKAVCAIPVQNPSMEESATLLAQCEYGMDTKLYLEVWYATQNGRTDELAKTAVVI